MIKKYSLALALLCVTFSVQATFTDQANIPSWGNAAVEDLVSAEIIGGNADGSLAPWRSINRAEFLKILTTATGVNIVQSSGKYFPDVPVNAWFSPYVHTAVSLGWAKGYPDGTFGPGNLINRAEIAKLLSEAWDLPLEPKSSDAQWFDVYMRSLETTDTLPYGLNLSRFDPGKNPSRIEVFEQLHRAWDTEEEITEELVIPAIVEEEIVTEEDENLTEAEETEETTNTDTSSETSESETTEETEKTEEAPPEEPNTDPEPPIIPEPEPDLTALEIESLSEATTQIIYPGQGGITGFVARLTPFNGSPVIKSLTFTHNGNAPVTNFSRMWLYDDNERISDEIIPNGGTNVLQFIPELTVHQEIDIYLKLDTPSAAEPGYTSRWSILSVDTAETTTDTSVTNFPINGQWLEIHPE